MSEQVTNAEYYKIIGAFIVVGGTILGASIAGVINWLNSRSQRKWEKEKWLREHRETAYSKCLEYLSKSRQVPEDANGKLMLWRKDFLGRMQSLQYVKLWITVIEAYSTEASKSQIENAAGHLFDCIDKVRIESAKNDGEQLILDHGLSEAIDKTLEVIVECTKKELSD